MQAEDRAAHQRRRAGLDDADAQVAVLDGAREVTFLERRPHRQVLVERDVPTEHERLGPPADRGPQGAHPHLTGLRRFQPDRPDLGHAGFTQPERPRLALHRTTSSGTGEPGRRRPRH
jgi:hypothetical protein